MGVKLSITYKVRQGDTFERIARQQYGAEVGAINIQRANPGAIEPLIPGTFLVVPPFSQNPIKKAASVLSVGSTKVSLFVGGQLFEKWEQAEITRGIDSMDSVRFTAPMDESAEFRASFKPLSFSPVAVSVGDIPLFTGLMVGVDPSISSIKKAVSVSCYSIPAILGDCTAPAASAAWEFNGQGLREIALTMAAPFGVASVFTSDPGAVFERTAIKTGQKVLPFLVGLANQRSLIVSSTSQGVLEFKAPTVPVLPSAILSQGSSPLVSVEPNIQPQNYYSTITGIEPAKIKRKDATEAGSQFTVKNPLLAGIVRPYNYTVDDTESADMPAAVEGKAARMFAGAAAYTAMVSSWRTPAEKLWRPGDLISLTAPDAMIYRKYNFIIRRVTFTVSKDTESARLELVLPGVFSGELPESMPWDF